MLTTSLASWRRWRVPLSVGVLDQAVVSGANFLLNILLARWLSPRAYGAFAIAFSLLLLWSGPHAALLSDPINVVGPRHFGGRSLAYLRAVVTLHWTLTIPLGILVAGTALLPLGTVTTLSPIWFLALGVATPLVPSLWLLRGACYLEGRPSVALVGSVLYTISLLLLIVLARTGDWLTGPVALTLMAVATAVASVFVAVNLGLGRATLPKADLSFVVFQHWSYGRWILGASIANGIALGLYLPLVGVFAGLDQTAVLRVLQNLILPLQQVLTAVALVAYPSMSRNVVASGGRYLLRRGPLFVMGGTGLAVIYGVLISAVGAPLLSVLFGAGRYTAYSGLIPLIALVGIVAALAQFLGILVRVIDQPSAVLWSKLAGAAWLAVVGVSLVRGAGVRGALLSLVGGSVVEALVLGSMLARNVKGFTAHK